MPPPHPLFLVTLHLKAGVLVLPCDQCRGECLPSPVLLWGQCPRARRDFQAPRTTSCLNTGPVKHRAWGHGARRPGPARERQVSVRGDSRSRLPEQEPGQKEGTAPVGLCCQLSASGPAPHMACAPHSPWSWILTCQRPGMLFPEPTLDRVWSRQLERTADLWMTSQVIRSGLLFHFKAHSNHTALARQLGGGDPTAVLRGPLGWLPAPGLAFPRVVRLPQVFGSTLRTPPTTVPSGKLLPKLLLESWFYGSHIF